MEITCRPISSWPWPVTSRPRIDHFRVQFDRIRRDLTRELAALGATEAVVELDMSERLIRRDGWPLSTAQTESPRVVVSFNSKHGALRYKCDAYGHWWANLRAISLSLEALRAVDRHGVTSRGEQYSGWAKLPASTGATMDTKGAAHLIDLEGNWGSVENILDDLSEAKEAVRAAQKNTHPDAGGSTERFQAVQQAKEILARHHGQPL